MLAKILITISFILNPVTLVIGKPLSNINQQTAVIPSKLPLSVLQEKQAEKEEDNISQPKTESDGFNSGSANTLSALAISANNLSNPNFLPIRDWNIDEPELDVKAGLITLVNPDNSSPEKDKILYKENMEQVLSIASLTKLMTALIVLENVNLDQIIVVSEEALSGFGDKGGLVANEKITAGNLLRAMLVESSNDAALALAESVEQRTRRNFVDLMNKKAEEIGLKETFFIDPSGYDQGNVSTVKEIVELVKYTLDQPIIWQILRTKEINTLSVDGEIFHRWINTNKLLDLPNIIGGKTGYTDTAGGCMALVEERIVKSKENSKYYLITIVLGAKDRFLEIEKLLDWTNQAYKW